MFVPESDLRDLFFARDSTSTGIGNTEKIIF